MDKEFGEQILQKLQSATDNILESVVQEAIQKVSSHADYPERWPIELVGKNISTIAGSHRLIDSLADNLSQYGISAYIGDKDRIFVDIMDLCEEGDNISNDESEVGIPPARQAGTESFNMKNAKLNTIMDYVGGAIREEINVGNFRATISVDSTPVLGEKALIKRLLKTLAHLGYIVFSDGRKIDVSSRPEYDKIKNLDISWEHHKR